MAFKDHFSGHAQSYARHRPTYPSTLFEYLASVSPAREWAWDCGTGNGQAALGLAPYFEHVLATDPSEEQLRNAFPHEKVTYRVALAEDPGIDPGTLDLVTVAQALHWFDVPRFFNQAKEALKPDGVIAVWCYSLCRIEPDLDEIVDRFYFDTVGPYWPRERALVDDGYRSLAFPFEEITAPEFAIELSWNFADLISYLETWSPVRRYIERHGTDPVMEVARELGPAWGNPEEEKLVRWPIHMRIGRAPGSG